MVAALMNFKGLAEYNLHNKCRRRSNIIGALIYKQMLHSEMQQANHSFEQDIVIN